MMMDLWDFFRAFNGIYIMGFWRFFPDVFFLFGGRPNLDDRISSKWGSFFTMTLEEFSSPEVVDGHMSNEQKPAGCLGKMGDQKLPSYVGNVPYTIIRTPI